jgi:hypothetical protein
MAASDRRSVLTPCGVITKQNVLRLARSLARFSRAFDQELDPLKPTQNGVNAGLAHRANGHTTDFGRHGPAIRLRSEPERRKKNLQVKRTKLGGCVDV